MKEQAPLDRELPDRGVINNLGHGENYHFSPSVMKIPTWKWPQTDNKNWFEMDATQYVNNTGNVLQEASLLEMLFLAVI